MNVSASGAVWVIKLWLLCMRVRSTRLLHPYIRCKKAMLIYWMTHTGADILDDTYRCHKVVLIYWMTHVNRCNKVVLI